MNKRTTDTLKIILHETYLKRFKEFYLERLSVTPNRVRSLVWSIWGGCGKGIHLQKSRWSSVPTRAQPDQSGKYCVIALPEKYTTNTSSLLYIIYIANIYLVTARSLAKCHVTTHLIIFSGIAGWVFHS